VAGAYWRGDEENAMLTRIYGLAFATADDLAAYKLQREEARRRDHRKLGQELELFTFSDEIGPGLPVWLPHGTVIRDELERLAKEREFQLGYERVSTPVITKEALFVKSGHLPHYRDSMYSPMDIDGEPYFIKPMNCPFHHVVYQSKPRSYRDLPLRLTEYGLCHRYEKSGELQGLMRVRSMWMNDAHIYVTPEQVKDEMKAVIGLHRYYYDLLGITKVRYRLSLHDPADLGGKYVDEPKAWLENEQIVREVLQELGVDFYEAPNEASFYGPKVDINIYSAIGKEYTLGTAQLDFAQPQRFGLTYTAADGHERMPYCIHRAPLSVHERFIGFLIEHFAGAFPLWLSPEQVRVASVSDAHIPGSRALVTQLREVGLRAHLDATNESVGKKIRSAEVSKIPYSIVFGEKEASGQPLQVRVRGQKEPWTGSREDFVARAQQLNASRSLEL
jgi:threonyl-tRNA synthetase